MPVQQNVSGLIDAGGEVSRPALVGGARRKAENLIGLLRRHRAWATPGGSRVRVSICVFTPAGEAAVQISL